MFLAPPSSLLPFFLLLSLFYVSLSPADTCGRRAGQGGRSSPAAPEQEEEEADKKEKEERWTEKGNRGSRTELYYAEETLKLDNFLLLG